MFKGTVTLINCNWDTLGKYNEVRLSAEDSWRDKKIAEVRLLKYSVDVAKRIHMETQQITPKRWP